MLGEIKNDFFGEVFFSHVKSRNVFLSISHFYIRPKSLCEPVPLGPSSLIFLVFAHNLEKLVKCVSNKS